MLHLESSFHCAGYAAENILVKILFSPSLVGSVYHWLWSSDDPPDLCGFFWLCTSPEQQRFLCCHFYDGESGCALMCAQSPGALILS